MTPEQLLTKDKAFLGIVPERMCSGAELVVFRSRWQPEAGT